MKHFSFLRPLCGVVLFMFSAAAAAEVCFENLNKIVLQDPNVPEAKVTYDVLSGVMPCTVDDQGIKQLVIEFELQGLSLDIRSAMVNSTDAQDSQNPVQVGFEAPVDLVVAVRSSPVAIADVTVIADSTPGTPGGDVNCGTKNVNDVTDVDFVCSFPSAGVAMLPGTITASATGVVSNENFYIQPTALEIFDVVPETQAVTVGDNGVPIIVSVRSVNPGTITGVSVLDNLGGSCSGSASVDQAGSPFSCDVEELQAGASPQNGVLTASGTNALPDTAGYTLEQLGLVVTNVSPSLDNGETSVQVVNIGVSGDVAVSVLSNGSAISNVTVTDNRGGSCVPLNGTTVASTGTFVWDCAVAPTGSPANGTLTANAAGVTSDNAGYTINPTQLSVALSGVPGCVDAGGTLDFDVIVTHNNPAASVPTVDVNVSGTTCSGQLSNVPNSGATFDCTFNPGSFPVSGSATATSASAAQGTSSNFNVNQCQGQLPAYCSDPEHNAVLAPGVVTNIMSLGNAQIGFWNNGAWFNSPGSTENVNFASNTILALPFQPPGPGQGGGDNVNNGRITMTRPGTGARVSISDCPGDFSDERPFQSHPQYGNDTALGFSDPSPDPGDHPCRVGGATSITLKWAMSAGAAIDLNTCVMLVPGQTYYLNVGQISPDGSGGWTGNGCTGSGCIVSMEQGTE